ncbi:hypothetical protein PUN28_010592 [Cardiocondyla obscurior]|uniref:Uncharacterized protein n=1 Tax=Cardiocondyla obscurior TaxID=286306 RepID=A0AAW2FKA6_9HYME
MKSKQFRSYFLAARRKPLYCTAKLIPEASLAGNAYTLCSYVNLPVIGFSLCFCKSTTDVTSIRHETLPLRHLENLRIKRFVDADEREEEKKIIRLFPAIKGSPLPRSSRLARRDDTRPLVSHTAARVF